MPQVQNYDHQGYWGSLWCAGAAHALHSQLAAFQAQFLLSDGAASPGLTALQVMESLGFKTILPWAQEPEQVSLSLSELICKMEIPFTSLGC